MKLGLVAGRHQMPVDDYVLESVSDPTDIDGIRDAVYKSLSAKLDGHVKQCYGIGLNQTDSTDVLGFHSDVKVELFVTGLTAVTLAVVEFCAANGVPLVCYHYDRDTGDYIAQAVLD